MNDSNEIKFSVVVPVCNQAGPSAAGAPLERLYDRLTASADQLAERYEMIFVDDGSTDETPSALRSLAERDYRVRVVELSRRFGALSAVSAGCDLAVGAAVIVVAGDGRHPMDAIPRLVAQWREGFEVVLGIPQGQAKAARGGVREILRRLGLERTQADDPDDIPLRLLDRKVVEALRQMPAQGRPETDLVPWMGFRQATVPFRPGAATSKAPMPVAQIAQASEAAEVAIRPMRLLAMLGAAMVALALLYAAAALALLPFGWPGGLGADMLMTLVGLFGMQIAALGMLGAYLGRITAARPVRPLYVIREKVGFPIKPTAELEATQRVAAHDEDNPITIFT